MIIYARADERYLDEMQKHLRQMVRENLITV
jgi:hypothetical protein